MVVPVQNYADAPTNPVSQDRLIGHTAVISAIALSAIIMMVGTASLVLPKTFKALAGTSVGPSHLLVTALLLNIALVLFGLHRYRQMISEIALHRLAEEEARAMADRDPLTGCLNRRSLTIATDLLLAQSDTGGEVLAAILIDLDKFKQINDFNGHDTGDRILLESANRIAAQLPDSALFARMGGDEFVCIIPFRPDREDRIERIAQGIIEAMGKPIEANGLQLESTASLGIARSDFTRIDNADTGTIPSLLHMADIAMYHAKHHGRNCFFWFEISMESELRFRSELESGIRLGIAKGEFVPYYEQQIDLQSGKLTGFEMLARWHSPKLGLVSPETFIPVAEEIGAIAALSESLIAQALHDAAGWNAELSLSINISPIQLRDPWFAQKILKMLVAANFPPQRLDIEITESCLHENIAAVRTLVTSLKNQGIRISLDDFGTGYSSLAQLRSLPFDRIKIDRSFVTNMNENADSATIVKAITALGQGLGLPITAEGIETEDVLDALKGIGNIKGQGYLYGKPECADTTRKRLEKANLLSSKAPSPVAEQAKPAKQRRRA